MVLIGLKDDFFENCFLDKIIITSGPRILLGIDKFRLLGCSRPSRTTNPMRIAIPDSISDKKSINNGLKFDFPSNIIRNPVYFLSYHDVANVCQETYFP